MGEWEVIQRLHQDLNGLIPFSEYLHEPGAVPSAPWSSPLWQRGCFPYSTLLKSKAIGSLVQVTPLITAKPGLNPKPSFLTSRFKRLDKKGKRGKEFFICLAVTHLYFALTCSYLVCSNTPRPSDWAMMLLQPCVRCQRPSSGENQTSRGK